MNPFEDVLKFMQIGHPDKLAERPRIPPEEIYELCESLIKEELRELRRADVDEDLIEIADGIADLIWVLICKALCYGIPIEKVWAEVAKTNMAKFPGGVVIRRPEDGKILKPPGWAPPDIYKIILDARGKCPTPDCDNPGDGNSPTGHCPECVEDASLEPEE